MSVARALIVDDDDSWRDLLKEILEDHGFEVDLASNLEDGRALVKDRSHKLAVIDLSLGGADHRNLEGLLVLDQISISDPSCRAVLLTGYATVELAVRVITEGKALSCLRKESFSRAEFRELLQRAAAAPPSPPAPLSPAPSKPRQSRGRALVVEDDAGWREM